MKKVLLFFVFLVMFIPRIILAEGSYEVYVNGKDIYEDRNTVYGASFENDEGEFILTLDGYSGNKILFKNFDDEDTIKIFVKGENTINSKDDSDAKNVNVAAITADADVTFDIIGEDGSFLNISDYINGILLSKGNVLVNNLGLSFNNLRYGIATEDRW